MAPFSTAGRLAQTGVVLVQVERALACCLVMGQFKTYFIRAGYSNRLFDVDWLFSCDASDMTRGLLK